MGTFASIAVRSSCVHNFCTEDMCSISLHWIKAGLSTKELIETRKLLIFCRRLWNCKWQQYIDTIKKMNTCTNTHVLNTHTDLHMQSDNTMDRHIDPHMDTPALEEKALVYLILAEVCLLLLLSCVMHPILFHVHCVHMAYMHTRKT